MKIGLETAEISMPKDVKTCHFSYVIVTYVLTSLSIKVSAI